MIWKKIKYYLQHVDGIWSVPLMFAVFWLAGLVISHFFGYGTGTYDPGIIQPLFLAGTIVIGATNFAVWGLFFTFKGLYRYLYGERNRVGARVNFSKIDWIKLSVWQRYLCAFGAFFYFVTAIILVYLKLV